MKRLVILGEGHGEVFALPILVGKLLQEKKSQDLYVDRNIIRTSPARMIRWDRSKKEPDFSEWITRLTLAARRADVGGVLAVYDGDFKTFPPGSGSPFCASTAAKFMAAAAGAAGAGKIFSLSVVFACAEYETWLIGGVESLAGRRLSDGRILVPANVSFPEGERESHGKSWLVRNCQNYRPTRDQAALTEMLDLNIVRARELRSFQRLDHALDQLLEAVAADSHISTPV